MSNQEMQFADPEWRSPAASGHSRSREPAEDDHTQPVTQGSYREKAWIVEESSEIPQPEAPPAPPLFAPRAAASQAQWGRRRSHFPWGWLIAIAIIFMLLSSMGGFAGYRFTQHSGPYPFNSHGPVSDNSQVFAVSGVPTLNIQGLTGNLHIHVGATNSVTIQQEGDGFRSRPEFSVSRSPDGNTLTLNILGSGQDDINLDITVPEHANLNLATSGDIDINGISGQMSLQSDDGHISLTNSTLEGQSLLQTTDGDITFQGSLNAHGSYNFQSQSGHISLTLPDDLSVHIDATAKVGEIHTTIPGVNVQHTGAFQNEVHTDLGQSPSAHVTVSTDMGDIDLDTQGSE